MVRQKSDGCSVFQPMGEVYTKSATSTIFRLNSDIDLMILRYALNDGKPQPVAFTPCFIRFFKPVKY
jgi:hypothetical protein